jgi:hypothetical protein
VEQGGKDSTVDDGLQSQQVYSSLESTEITSIGTVDQVSTLRSTVDVIAQKPLKIRVGDRCRYNGSPGAMAVSCRGKSLIVLETRLNSDVMEVRVKADEWTVDHWISYQQLRREMA